MIFSRTEFSHRVIYDVCHSNGSMPNAFLGSLMKQISAHTRFVFAQFKEEKVRELSELFIRHSTPSVSDRNSATVEGDKYFFRAVSPLSSAECVHTFFFHSRRKTRIMPAEAESQKGGKEKRRKKIDGRNVVT